MKINEDSWAFDLATEMSSSLYRDYMEEKPISLCKFVRAFLLGIFVYVLVFCFIVAFAFLVLGSLTYPIWQFYYSLGIENDNMFFVLSIAFWLGIAYMGIRDIRNKRFVVKWNKKIFDSNNIFINYIKSSYNKMCPILEIVKDDEDLSEDDEIVT